MQTIKHLLIEAENLLRKSTENHKLEAKLLLSSVLNIKHGELSLHYSDIVSQENIDAFLNLVSRREKNEPIQHIFGEMDFYNVRVKSDSRALIPRHETEYLIEIICKTDKNPQKILDLGTGTGAIAIALAKNFPNAEVLAVDISDEALELAQENIAMNGVKNVKLIKSNWFENVSGKFDIIIANPPYLTKNEWQIAQPEVRNFDPFIALVADDNGMYDLKKIIKQATDFLATDGIMYLETGCNQHEFLTTFAHDYFKSVESVKDLQKRDRFLTMHN